MSRVYRYGVASPPCPESCAGPVARRRAALTGEPAGRVLSVQWSAIRCRAVPICGRQTGECEIARLRWALRRSTDPCMVVKFTRENGRSLRRPAVVTAGGEGRDPEVKHATLMGSRRSCSTDEVPEPKAGTRWRRARQGNPTGQGPQHRAADPVSGHTGWG